MVVYRLATRSVGQVLGLAGGVVGTTVVGHRRLCTILMLSYFGGGNHVLASAKYS